MRTATVTLCALLLTTASLCGGDPPKKGRMVFIFCDVTTSLEGPERTEVARMAADILNHLPPGTSYNVYPIQAETAALTPVNRNETVIPGRDKDEGQQMLMERRRKQSLVDELANVSQKTNAPQGPSERRDDNRTCILNALNFAGNQFKQFSADKYDRELVIVSDMLEECTDTPLKRQINVKKPDITQELKLAGDFPEWNDFSNVKITIITPVTLDTYVKHAPGKKPPMRDLQDFWKAIFTRCKVSPEAEKNGMYSWSDGSVPAYLLAQNQ